ncbi:MAG: extracellular solute-binding protein, partial [Pseudomonadota bacterium]
AWDPANALIELSKQFEEESGHNMSFEFVPWPNFADRMLNELNSGGQLCDLLIGDSQWIGGAAENGQYVKLNEFFEENNIDMADFLPATVTGYAEWPKNTPNYYALPAYADVVGWTYRKDWFERPELQSEFKEKHGRDLAVPNTLAELKDIAQFFQNRDIDGTTVYGAAIYTERGSEGITMGVTNALYNYGFEYNNPDKPYELEGFVNSPGAVEALEFYKELYDTATPPGSSNWYMGENIDAYKSGQVALQMNFAFIWPGVEADANVGGGKSGYFPNPAGPGGHFAQLGGQGISVVANSPNRDAALEYIKWFAQEDVQQQWWDIGGAPALRSVLEAPGFEDSQPFAKTFLDSMAIVKDFWAEPAYADLLLAMQERVHNYVIAGEGTAQEALDGLVGDWIEVFEDEGKL